MLGQNRSPLSDHAVFPHHNLQSLIPRCVMSAVAPVTGSSVLSLQVEYRFVRHELKINNSRRFVSLVVSTFQFKPLALENSFHTNADKDHKTTKACNSTLLLLSR